MADLDQFRLPDKAPDPSEYERPRSSRGTSDLTLDAGMPANIDAEKTILGAILLDPQDFNEAAEILEADDFSLDSHRRIYLRMAELIDAQITVDIVTLANELARQKEIEAVGGVAYLASLTEGLPRRPKIDAYIRIVKDRSMLRKLMLICSATIARAADQSEDAIGILEVAEAQLLEVAQENNGSKLRSIYQSVESAGGTDEYLKRYTEPSLEQGLKTGFVDFDRMTGGLQKSDLIIIAARPSMGKTALALNIAEFVGIESKGVVAIFSIEMSRPALELRFIAARAWVDVRRAMAGFYVSDLEKEKLGRALGDLVESRIFIDDSAVLTPVQMRAKARRLKQREGRLDLVMVDYLQLMQAGSKTSNRQEEVAMVSRSLKACAKELECPVIALAQLHRGPEQRQDKRPVLADLRESGQIEQDADVVAFIHRDAYYDPDNEDVRNLADLIIAKQRNGPTGNVKLHFAGTLTRFQNLARD